MKPDHQYDAYFPFIEDIMLDRTAVPVDYTNQKQTGNNNMAHLGAHDYLAAQGTTNGQGGVNYTFQRMGAVAILNFTVPDAGTELTSVTLKANDNFDGGFRISVNNGNAYYDYSTEAVVEMLSNYLSPRVTELLKEAE